MHVHILLLLHFVNITRRYNWRKNNIFIVKLIIFLLVKEREKGRERERVMEGRRGGKGEEKRDRFRQRKQVQ